MAGLAICGGEATRKTAFPLWPQVDEEAVAAVSLAVRSGNWGGPGAARGAGLVPRGGLVQRFEREMGGYHSADYALAVSSGTTALEVALRALGIGPGDEVVVPGYTNVSSAMCVSLVGATPTFADVEPTTLNVDASRVDDVVGERTRAVVIVHFAGLSANLGALIGLCKRRGIAVVEDAAHAHGSEWEGRRVGAIGDIGALSFQESKNVTTGEGGMVLTNREDLYRLCLSIHDTGKTLEGPWYEHQRVGPNGRFSSLQAALGLWGLRRLDDQVERREANVAYFHRCLDPEWGLQPMSRPRWATRHSHHLIALRIDGAVWEPISRQRWVRALRAEGIPCMVGYGHGVYQNACFERKRGWAERCVQTELACREVIWLPQNVFLASTTDVDEVLGAINKLYHCRAELAVRLRDGTESTRSAQ